MLKYGRNQELEADKMGLYLMAMAGYDPRQAKPFGKEWKDSLLDLELLNSYLHTQVLKPEDQILINIFQSFRIL
jgi:predicted Zn-dependent protease